MKTLKKLKDEFFIKNFVTYNINNGELKIFDKKDKRPLVVKWSD